MATVHAQEPSYQHRGGQAESYCTCSAFVCCREPGQMLQKQTSSIYAKMTTDAGITAVSVTKGYGE